MPTTTPTAELLGTDTEVCAATAARLPSSFAGWSTATWPACSTGRHRPAWNWGRAWLDLSRLYVSAALGLLMGVRSLLAPERPGERFGQASCRAAQGWAVLSHLATDRWLQATFKLSRAYGVANVAVVHRLSDLKAAGYGRLPARAAGRRVAGRRRDPGGVRPGDRGSRSGGGELWACPGPSR
jgi:hypothetical protein